jgi:hypothetical protein
MPTRSEQLLPIKFLEASVRALTATTAINQAGLLLLRAEMSSLTTSPELKVEFDELNNLLIGSNTSTKEYFAGMLLIHEVSQFEIFLVEVIRAAATTYPKKLSRSFKLSEVLDLTREELVENAAEQYINELTYKRPIEFLGDIANFLSIDKEKVLAAWNEFAALKARRDVGVHNAWVVNETYIRKVTEALGTCAQKVGDKVQPTLVDLRESNRIVRQAIQCISDELTRVYG